MKYGFSAWLALLLSVLLVAPSDAAEQVGKVFKAKSTVYSAGKPTGPGDPIYFRDRLSTNATGVGEFTFQDGTKLALGPSASLVVDQFVIKNRSRFAKLGINATKGTFRWISGSSPHSAYKIRTPTGTMGIQGTAFDVTNRGGWSHIVLLNGSATFCAGGRCTTLNRTGDYIKSNGSSISPKMKVSQAFKSKKDAGKIFPFLANPGMLSSRFRVSGSNVLTSLSDRQFGGRSEGGGSPENKNAATRTNDNVGPKKKNRPDPEDDNDDENGGDDDENDGEEENDDEEENDEEEGNDEEEENNDDDEENEEEENEEEDNSGGGGNPNCQGSCGWGHGGDGNKPGKGGPFK